MAGEIGVRVEVSGLALRSHDAQGVEQRDVPEDRDAGSLAHDVVLGLDGVVDEVQQDRDADPQPDAEEHGDDRHCSLLAIRQAIPPTDDRTAPHDRVSPCGAPRTASEPQRSAATPGPPLRRLPIIWRSIARCSAELASS